MANRVTPDEVKEILDVDDVITNIKPFIDAANELVTNVCVDSSLTVRILKEIERWLAAHFTAIRDVRSAKEAKAGDYQYKVDLNLHQTQYGQQALVLDFSGALARLNKAITDDDNSTRFATFQVFGR